MMPLAVQNVRKLALSRSLSLATPVAGPIGCGSSTAPPLCNLRGSRQDRRMTSPPASVPHPAATELRRWSLDSVGGLRLLRAGLREVAVRAPLGGEDGLDRLAVVATELATNALRHGRAPALVR